MSTKESEDFEFGEVIGEDVLALTAFTQKPVQNRQRLDEILMSTGVSLDDFKLIKSASRKRHLTRYKRLYAQEAVENNYTLKEIAQNIGVTDTAILKLLE